MLASAYSTKQVLVQPLHCDKETGKTRDSTSNTCDTNRQTQGLSKQMACLHACMIDSGDTHPTARAGAILCAVKFSLRQHEHAQVRGSNSLFTSW